MTAVFGFDFSCSKPAMTSYIDGKIEFYVWPAEIDDVSLEKLTSCGAHIFNRELHKIKPKSLDQHQLIIEHTTRATKLSEMILDTINEICEKNNIKRSDVYVANESFAFSRSGNATLQLAGYKYILMHDLMKNGYTNLKTYSPIRIKKTAGCSQKGLGKEAMINAMAKEPASNMFMDFLQNHNDVLRKKTNYVLCMDDIADSYWNMKTCLADIG